MTWSPAQYVKFEQERSRPVRDLLDHLPNKRIARAADIGCGPGNSTEVLQERFPDAVVIGIDSSTEMIAAARRRLPGNRFEIQNITAWHTFGNPFDVILANAVLQWVPDHAALLPSLIAKLSPGVSLAVQVPANLEESAPRFVRLLPKVLGGKSLRKHRLSAPSAIVLIGTIARYATWVWP